MKEISNLCYKICVNSINYTFGYGLIDSFLNSYVYAITYALCSQLQDLSKLFILQINPKSQ